MYKALQRLTLQVSLTSFPASLLSHSSHTRGCIFVHQSRCLRVFAFAVPTAWTGLPSCHHDFYQQFQLRFQLKCQLLQEAFLNYSIKSWAPTSNYFLLYHSLYFFCNKISFIISFTCFFIYHLFLRNKNF